MNKDKVCRHLPVSIVDRATTSTERNEYLINMLRNILPVSDINSISDEMKKTFTFDKHKIKHAPRKRKKAKFLTARKRTLLGLNKLERKSDLKYADALTLNQLWLDYVKQMLGIDKFSNLPQQPVDPNWDNVGQQLLKADFHGAKISVIRSKCPSLVGLAGIVLQDTKCTFRAIGEDDVVRTIPKEVCVFKIFLTNGGGGGGGYFQFFGKELCVRPAERSVKKFKSAHMPDL